MTKREAVHILCMVDYRDVLGKQFADAVDTLRRSLSRPTRLEREAARLMVEHIEDLRVRGFGYRTEAMWLAAYEKKRGKR